MSVNGSLEGVSGITQSRVSSPPASETNQAIGKSSSVTPSQDQRSLENAGESAESKVDISGKASLVLSLETDFGIDLTQAGLSENQLKQLGTLLEELDSLEQKIVFPPLSEAKQRELFAIDQQIMEIYQSSSSQPLTAIEMRRLDELHQQQDQILGPPLLTEEQQSRLDKINDDIDALFNQHFDPQLLDDEITTLESLFNARDELLLGQELSKESEADMLQIEQAIDALLDKNVRSEEDDDARLHGLFEELEAVLGHSPLTERQQQALREVDESIFNVLKSVDQSGLSRGEKQQLDDLLDRADKVLGYTDKNQEQLQQLEQLQLSVNQLLSSGKGNDVTTGYVMG